MKSRTIFALVALLVIILSVEAGPGVLPELQVPSYLEGKPGEIIIIEVVIKNTNEKDSKVKLWDSKVYIDIISMDVEDLSQIEILNSEVLLPELMYPEEEAKASFQVRIRENADARDVKISFVLEGRRGTCKAGCIAFSVPEKGSKPIFTTLSILKSEPRIGIRTEEGYQIHQNESLKVPLTIVNLGLGDALNLRAEVFSEEKSLALGIEEIPRTLKGNQQISVILHLKTNQTSVGIYLIKLKLTYWDEFGSSYEVSKEILLDVVQDLIEVEEPPKEEIEPIEAEEDCECELEENQKIGREFFFGSALVFLVGGFVFLLSMRVGIVLGSRRH
ncbi:MAG: hypothetical protein ACE5HW_04975 [Candidatus Methanofastidiosia archaeon]